MYAIVRNLRVFGSAHSAESLPKKTLEPNIAPAKVSRTVVLLPPCIHPTYIVLESGLSFVLESSKKGGLDIQHTAFFVCLSFHVSFDRSK